MQYHKIKKKVTYKRKEKVTAREVGSMPRAKPSRKNVLQHHIWHQGLFVALLRIQQSWVSQT